MTKKENNELKNACEIVEKHCRSMGMDFQVTFTTKGVEVSPLYWDGSVFDKNLYFGMDI